MNQLKVLWNGIIKENPTFVLLLGMCPTLGTTSSAINGMSMGLATMAVLVFSNLIISLIKNLVPDMVRIPSFIVVIASLILTMPLVHHIMAVLLEFMFFMYSGWMEYYVPFENYALIAITGILAYGIIAFFQMKKVKQIPMEDALKNVE